ncbi:unnamed protein product [Cylicocyclus nassatus]|uniref:Uncharacterized protein n=1 Tax=Cylicocyclus nassatus TaxID=53992 RepID=A0AA36DQZ0_CYLNA|nr:unnamed protein product [Cylicocyclus nassatus]
MVIRVSSGIFSKDCWSFQIPVRHDPGVLSLDVRDGEVKAGLHVSSSSIDQLKPPSRVEKDFTEEVAEKFWVLLTDTFLGIKVADDVEEEFSYGNRAKELLIQELAEQERYAWFRWVDSGSAMSSDLLSAE